MQKPKLQIIPKRYKEETTVISMRAPKDMVADLDKIAEQTGRSRTDFLLTEYRIFT